MAGPGGVELSTRNRRTLSFCLGCGMVNSLGTSLVDD